MTKEEKKLKKLIEESQRVLVTTHVSPDPDAKASAILVYHALTKHMDKEDVSIITQDIDKQGAGKVNWGYVKEEFVFVQRDTEVDLEEYDLVIITDADEMLRCMESALGDRKSYKLAILDHHQAAKGAPEKADIYINEMLSSAAEQVYSSFKSIIGEEWSTDKYVSEITQYGILADTNRFMYDIVQPSTYRVMADLIEEHKVDIEVYMNTLTQNTHDSYLVFKECLENFRIVDNWGYSWITKQFILDNDLTKADLNSGASAFLNDYARKLEGVDWGFLLKESMQTEGRWGISFRSIAGGREVNKIAEKLGGGGHKWAAGCRFMAEDKDDAIQKVLSAIE